MLNASHRRVPRPAQEPTRCSLAMCTNCRRAVALRETDWRTDRGKLARPADEVDDHIGMLLATKDGVGTETCWGDLGGQDKRTASIAIKSLFCLSYLSSRACCPGTNPRKLRKVITLSILKVAPANSWKRQLASGYTLRYHNFEPHERLNVRAPVTG